MRGPHEDAHMPAKRTRCRIRPMRLGDIPQVMDIERESFPTMWPQTTYRKELKNKLARLDQERRQLMREHLREVASFQERLLDLLIQHAYLHPAR